jgi:hypothetical protein
LIAVCGVWVALSASAPLEFQFDLVDLRFDWHVTKSSFAMNVLRSH